MTRTSAGRGTGGTRSANGSIDAVIEEFRFAADSPLEGAVTSEPVSEVQKLGADSGRVMDDSGIVKRCLAHEFGRKLGPLPRGVTPPSGYKSL